MAGPYGRSSGSKSIDATLTAENTFSDPIRLKAGDFKFTLSGSWSATVHVQSSPDGGTSWNDDPVTYTTNTVQIGSAVDGDLYRFGIKTGNYSSGSIVGRIEQ